MPVVKQRGVALIMVLWMIVVMLSLAVTLSYAVKTESNMMSYARETAQARAIAEAAAHYTVLQLSLPPDQRELKLGGDQVLLWPYQNFQTEIRVVGENGLINLNTAPRDLIQKALKFAELSDADSEVLLDQIEDFRDADPLKRVHGAEDEDYERAGRTNGAKDAPFETIEELQQVLAMTPGVYNTLVDYFSVYSNGSVINPMLAPRHVLMLLADGDSAAVDAYLQERLDAKGGWIKPSFTSDLMDSSESLSYRLQLTVKANNSDVVYREQRAIRLLPGRNPPFMTYYRHQLAESAKHFE